VRKPSAALQRPLITSTHEVRRAASTMSGPARIVRRQEYLEPALPAPGRALDGRGGGSGQDSLRRCGSNSHEIKTSRRRRAASEEHGRVDVRMMPCLRAPDAFRPTHNVRSGVQIFPVALESHSRRMAFSLSATLRCKADRRGARFEERAGLYAHRPDARAAPAPSRRRGCSKSRCVAPPRAVSRGAWRRRVRDAVPGTTSVPGIGPGASRCRSARF
jgi:hypothetical protein